MSLSDKEIERYSRQLLLKEVGLKGQKKLAEARVLVIGAGGLGSPVLLYLAGAGIGHIGIADFDAVDLSNLQRQILHSTNSLGIHKAESAKSTILNLNPEISVTVFKEKVTASNILSLISSFDIVVDCTDSAQTKFLINDACVLSKKPFVHGGILGFSGQLMTYIPGEGPCYRCIFTQPENFTKVQTCRDVGVIGALAGVIGSMQALEVIKFILGKGSLLTGKLFTYNALTLESRVMNLPKSSESCSVCNDSNFKLVESNYEVKECKL